MQFDLYGFCIVIFESSTPLREADLFQFFSREAFFPAPKHIRVSLRLDRTREGRKEWPGLASIGI